jgi:oligo-1,6-glucosidase
MIKYYMHGPKLHQYIQEMNREVLSKYPNAMTVAEGAGDSAEEAMNFVDPARKELNIAYHFESVDVGDNFSDYSLVKYKKMFADYDKVFKDKGWLAIFLANHDNPRMVNKFGSDTPEFREISSKMLSTFILTMRGTPFYYNGDELGMDNIKFDDIKDYNDVDTKNKYEHLREIGGDLKVFIEKEKQTSRENSRTPFQWNDTKNAGFTTGKPWLKVNPNYKTVNEEAENKDPNSTLNYFRQLVKLRKENPVLVYGKFDLVDAENPNVFAYTRELKGVKLLIILNFTDKNATLKIDLDLKNAKLILSNYKDLTMDVNLKPYESVIYKLK